MDKIEKIKEWVKKQKKEELARNSIGVITGKALFVDANDLLAFLDTLSEEPDKSLEEAAEEYEKKHTYQRYDGGGLTPEYDETLAEAFIAGSDWKESQMLKDAKDGYVSAIIIHNDGDEEHYAVTYPNGERPHSITDKVKIIIL